MVGILSLGKHLERSMAILRNSARCKRCQDEIESKYRHDFVSCKCGAISVDGGKAYLKRCGNPEDFEDTSEETSQENI